MKKSKNKNSNNDKGYIIRHSSGGWVLNDITKSFLDITVSVWFSPLSKKEAISYGKKLAKREATKLVVLKKNGSVKKTYNYIKPKPKNKAILQYPLRPDEIITAQEYHKIIIPEEVLVSYRATITSKDLIDTAEYFIEELKDTDSNCIGSMDPPGIFDIDQIFTELLLRYKDTLKDTPAFSTIEKAKRRTLSKKK